MDREEERDLQHRREKQQRLAMELQQQQFSMQQQQFSMQMKLLFGVMTTAITAVTGKEIDTTAIMASMDSGVVAVADRYDDTDTESIQSDDSPPTVRWKTRRGKKKNKKTGNI